ncbi:rRNA pseudouridine synthase [Rummeliibacillus sp. G93]|uniref:Pseudouridine synthase n=1 Tax=Rummeliibacillus stabekisii TaxID=241244 RepID=A0A143HAT8_9BACL|nr:MULTISPECIES: pseudouridine synthase [Rummeliibacillus]AMW98605.1 pseudouridine synthase [Rummeliibacillus stabekisii]MBB5169757.1 23S rRNA pseudouridine2605 synthase [Rummeliibacillus stabekisii]MCM3315934.1 rRNA pseudouridine synthase [Rummeliibacillus stabekisii]UQW98498.1 rRNA pseudouridine synthase [Rummeliibacillus sp. G93]GEL04015.1 ribosomal large subunit pseudouridine synthase B [Rummeliibacillus stabekisii]
MERLQKVIAHAGIASRRKAEELITEGKVKVNGQVVRELGIKVSSHDSIEVEGVKIEKEEKVYYLLYKPRGVISAVSDDRGRKTVLDLFPQVEQRIFPVGRLDFDTSGVLLLTNDGEFANQMTHPRYKIDKTYVAKVKGLPRREDLKKLERGIELEDGKTSPAKVKVLSSDKQQNKSIIALTIHEGKNRQVKRMFEAIGCPVQKLKREQFAFLGLHGLNAGESRELTAHEVKQLRVLSETGKIG